ncbi:hypothetical protein IIY68_03545 [Candidatus Saccharibacteria bacterium]|nr:hypothetical protein [Candidatus Saccharibacteria bacterium]
MGLIKKKSSKKAVPDGRAPFSSEDSPPPTLARRSANRHSTIKAGRTIGEQREKLETANERELARQKDKRKSHFRVFFVSFGFIILAVILVVVYFVFFRGGEDQPVVVEPESIYQPTIEIVDEDAAATSGKITSRMKDYIGQAEADFKALGYQPVRAVLPTGAVREVDFYLDGYSGFIKMIIDRGTAVSVEDADRLLRHLAGQGITNFEYIDVRLPHKAYWK